jgi:acetylornithine/succinyldiaminopimelate/putrescine aminotransferase
VSFTGSFHGRTLGTLAATDRPPIRVPFAPLASGFRSAAWNDPDDLEHIDRGVAAAIVEPVQGEAGVRVPDASWLRALRARCDEVGAALIFDEVQTGLGRCGRLWAHEIFGVTPDLMTLAKPLGGGLPIGATLVTERIAEAMHPGCHATTFGGGPLVTAVALRVLRAVAKEELLAGVRGKGDRLRRGLEALGSPLVQEVRGPGLLVAVESERAAELGTAAFDEELLLVRAGESVLRFLPPLNVTDEEIDDAVERFARACRRVEEDAS